MITNLLLGRVFFTVLLINLGFLKSEVLADFLPQESLSNVIGSTMQGVSVLTALIAIYEIPAVLSVIPMSIHAFERVNP